MIKKIWRKLTTTLAGGAIILASASVGSRLLGLVRDRLLASKFGAGDELDIYYAAFKIPDLIFNVLVLGALSAAFLPVFVEYIHKARSGHSKIDGIWSLANSVLNLLLLSLLIFGVLFFILAPKLVFLIAPGFSSEKLHLVAQMSRIMLISIIFFGISNIMTGILNSFKRYANFALSPIMYNLGIIGGIIFLVPRLGLYGLAYGVVIGSFLHLLVQIPGVLKLGYRYRGFFYIKDKGVKQIGKLMLPRAFGLAVQQIDQLVSVIIGSMLAAGSVAVFNLANNLQSFPINVFGVSMAVASFPFFSEAFAKKDNGMFVLHFSVSFRRILFLVMPVSVLILILRAEIVRVILGSGAFNWEDTKLTAQALGFFSISLFAQSVIPLLTRSFYAWQDTKTPVKVGIVAVVADILGAISFSRVFGVLGLALAFSIASVLQMLILLFLLRRKVGYLDDKRITVSVLKIMSISGLMGISVYFFRNLINTGVNLHTFMGVLIQGAAAGFAGLLVYLGLALIFRCDEIQIITSWLKKIKTQMLAEKGNG